MVGAAYWTIGGIAANVDLIRALSVGFMRRKVTRVHLRSVELVTIQKFASGIDATKARASRLRNIRNGLRFTVGSSCTATIVKGLIDHNPHAEWAVLSNWLGSHPLWNIAIIDSGLLVVAMILISWHCVNDELALCVAAGANDA